MESPLRPWVHKFATDANRYVFDVHTNRILRLGQIEWDLVDSFTSEREDILIRRFSRTYPPADISRAILSLRTAQKQYGVFVAARPQRFAPEIHKQHCERLITREARHMILMLTRRCNLQCNYCPWCGPYATKLLADPITMPWDVAKAAIDTFYHHSLECDEPTLGFFGGEPLEAFSMLRSCVRYARDLWGQRIGFSLTTNGTLLHGDVAQFVADAGIRLQISLDGPEHVHDRHRRFPNGNGSWRLVTDNVSRFLDQHPDYPHAILVNIVLSAFEDVESVDEFFSNVSLWPQRLIIAANDVTVNELSQPVVGLGGGDPSKWHSLLQRFVDAAQRGAIRVGSPERVRFLQALFEKPLLALHKRSLTAPTGMRRRVPTCVPGHRRRFVTPAGKYLICERVRAPDAMGNMIGDVRHGVDVERCWKLYCSWIAGTKDACKECWCVPICEAGCLAMTSGLTDENSRRQLCEEARRDTDFWLKMYCSILEVNSHALDYMRTIIVS